MNRYRLALALSSFLALSACSSPAPDDPPGPGGPTGATCPITGSNYTYDNFASKFFSDYCTRCHGSTVMGAARNGAPPERNFDSYSGIMATDASLIDSVAAAGPEAVNTYMPRSPPAPSNTERYELGEWLACHRPP